MQIEKQSERQERGEIEGEKGVKERRSEMEKEKQSEMRSVIERGKERVEV